MKIFKKLLIVFVFCFWLLNILKADLLPEFWEEIYILSECTKFVNFDKILPYQLIWVDEIVHWHEIFPDSVDYKFYTLPLNTCIKSFPRKLYLYNGSKKLRKEWVIVTKGEKLTEYQIDILARNTLWYDIENLDMNNLLYKSTCQNKDCYRNMYKPTEIVYKLQIIWNGSYKIYRIVWNDKKDYAEISVTNDENSFLRALLLTIVLETIALFFLCKLFFKQDEIKNWKIILTWIVASTCTLPILWFVLPNIFHNWTVFAIIGEVFVTIVEVFIIKYMLNIKRRKAIMASTACNLFSVLTWLFL